VDHRLTEDAVVTVSLPPGAPVRLRDFNATVVARVRSSVVLEPIGVMVEALPQRSEAVFVSFVSGTGLVALKGALTRERGALRFQVQDGIRVDARRYTRVDAELAVSLQRTDAEEGWSGTTVNIAQEGLLARTQLPVAMDDDVAVTLWLPELEQPLAPQAKVVRRGGDMVALHFLDVGPFEQAAIAEFVIEQRLAERQALGR
jgi:PilZ domain